MKKDKKTKGGSISPNNIASLINNKNNIVDACSKYIDWNSVINPEMIKNNYGIGYSTTGGRVGFPSRYFNPKSLKKKNQKGGGSILNNITKTNCTINQDIPSITKSVGPPNTNVPKNFFDKAINMFLGYQDSQLFQPSESNVSYNKFSEFAPPKYSTSTILNRDNAKQNETKQSSNINYASEMDHKSHEFNPSSHKHTSTDGLEHNHARNLSQKYNNDLNLNLNEWVKSPMDNNGNQYQLFDESIGITTTPGITTRPSNIQLLGAGKKTKKKNKKRNKKVIKKE